MLAHWGETQVFDCFETQVFDCLLDRGADGEGVACNGSVRRLSDVLREEGITKVQLLKVTL
jgi:hypothetical protein